MNALERRSGSLWNGRNKISPIDTGAYRLAFRRYGELNPVKAGMVPCDWLDQAETFHSLAGSQQVGARIYGRFVECEGSSKPEELIASVINNNKLTGGGKFID